MQITKRSVLTLEEHTKEIDITPEQYKLWEEGELIQNVAPNLSAADREFIISGSTEEEWKKFFGEEVPE